MSDLFPWPFLKRLPLLDTVLRNVVAQDLHFVQGELALLSFVTHWPWASETVTRKWADLSLSDVLMKFWAEFCWCVIYTYLLLQRPQERFTENMPGCCHNEGHTVQQSLLCGLGQAISWGGLTFSLTSALWFWMKMHPGHCIRALVPLLACPLCCSEPVWDLDLSKSAECPFLNFHWLPGVPSALVQRRQI